MKNGNWKAFILNNSGIKLLSILFALFTWTMIINIDDPYKSKTFSVKVETINEDALKSVNKVYEVVEGSTASVTVRGKRSIVDKLSSSDIRATADLSDLSAVNAVAIVPVLKKRINSDVTLECNQVLKVSLEDRKSKQVKVTVITEGSAEDGYSVGECVAKPNLIEVSGGASTIDKLDSVRVTLNIDGATENFSRKLEPVSYDVNGNQIISSTLRYDVEKVRVSATVLQNKTIPLKVKVTGEPATGYKYVKTVIRPQKIEIAGRKKKLADISEVTIPIDVSGMTVFSSGLEQNINIADYLDNDIIVLEEYQIISLQIVIENMVQRTLPINLSDIEFKGVSDGYTADFENSAQKAYVTVFGISSVVNNLTADMITAYIDCNGLKSGSYELPILTDLPSGCSQQSQTKLKVKILESGSSDFGDGVKATPESNVTEESNKPSPTDMVTNEPVPTENPDNGDEEETEDR